MLKKIKREIHLLSRAEQRALLSATTLLYLALLFHLLAPLWQLRPGRYAEAFMDEARSMLDSLATIDSLSLLALAVETEGRLRSAGPEPLVQRLKSYRPVDVQGGQHRGDGQHQGDGRLQQVDSAKLKNGWSSPAKWGRPVEKGRQVEKGLPVELNTADSLSLLPLPGIGPVLAGRIIKYRRLLGGFHDPAQLREVYGLREETYLRLRDRVKTDSFLVRSLDVNQASFRELLRHPYLEMEHVRAISAYRDFRGRVEEPGELLDEAVLPDSVFLRIRPYLEVAD